MLIGRRVGVDAYGVVTSLASTFYVIGAPAIVAQLIVARLAADLEARNDPGAIRRLADLATLVSLAIGVGVILVGYLAREPIAEFFKITDTAPVLTFVIGLALFGVVMVQRGVLQGAHCFTGFAISGSIETIMKVVAGVALAGFLGATGGLAGIDIGLGLALIYNLLTFALRFRGRSKGLALDPAIVTRVITHGGVGQLTLTILTFYDVPLVKHLFDPRAAGLFAAAALVGRAVFSATSFIPTIVLPKAAARLAVGRSPLSLLAAALLMAGIVVGLAAAAAAIAPRFVVTTIAGPAFGEAAPLVFWYIVASGALSLANVVAAYKMGLHRFDFVLPSFVIGVAEIVSISLWHPSLLAVVFVLSAGHAAVLASTLYRVTSWSMAPVRLGEKMPEVAL